MWYKSHCPYNHYYNNNYYHNYYYNNYYRLRLFQLLQLLQYTCYDLHARMNVCYASDCVFMCSFV